APDGAHTVVVARPGVTIEAGAARLLVQARPLHDVVTWAPGPPESRALGVLLGEILPAFAVRGHVLEALGTGLPELVAKGPDALALALAADPGLRWTHLPAALTADT